MRTIVVCLLPLIVLPSAHAEGDAARGKALYTTKCAACHSLDYNGVGPAHRGVFGRKAAALPDYAYSPALKAANWRWDETTLDRWLANPQAMAPGQRMGIQIELEGERADLIAYLKTATAK